MRKILLSIVSLIAIGAFAQTTSPNGKISVEQKSEGIEISYKNGKTSQTIMMMPVSSLVSCTKAKKVKVAYDMTLGKKSHCTNAYNEIVYTLGDGKTLTVRAYNDGVAWSGLHDYNVNFTSASANWLLKWTDSYEGFFPRNRETKKDERLAYPALFEYSGNVFALLSESCMKADNAGTSMYADDNKGIFSLRPDGKENGGWQTLIIGSMADVVESTLITDNSEPLKAELYEPQLTNQSGVAAWVYWAYNHGSNDFSIIKKYVDMAAELHLPYVLIDAEWDEMDKVASNNGKTIEDAVKYAIDKDIKPIIWYNSSVGWINGAPGPKFRLNKPEDREKEFAWCEKIGVTGVKIDFFSGDTNLNIKYMIELLECAAKHHLLVNFHGATIPRGWQRTYPNLVSTEGVYGAEWYNNVPTFTDKAASHNAMLPFTRNVIGSMDYTPCAFTDSQHPHITTHAHELALTALYESGIQHLADRPESFLSQPSEVKDYLSVLPAAWDETIFLSGYPGESAVMARRKGTTWYIAGINGEDSAKTLSFNIKRLNKLGKDIVIFEDSGDKSSPWKITKPSAVPTSIACQARGGFVIQIK